MAVIILGAQLRWAQFIETAGYVLDPDAQGFLQIIRTMQSPYDTAATIAPWVREPFFPWVGKVFFALVPDTTNSLRLLTVCLSIGVIWAAFEVGRRLYGGFVGFAAVLLLVFNDLLIFNAPRGLRLELYTLLLLGLFFWFVRLMKPPANQCDSKSIPCAVWWFALFASLSCLTRITTLATVLPLIVLLWGMRRIKIPSALVMISVVILPLLPHLLFNYHYSDERDPLFSSSVHARFYRNVEFAGQPGYPTAEEAKADPYGGPPISTFEYIFAHHGPVQWITIPARGVWRLYIREFAFHSGFSGNLLAFSLYALTFLLFISRRENMPIALFLAALTLPVVFVAGVVHMSGRLLGHFLPFFYIIFGAGLIYLRIFFAVAINFISKKIKPC